MEVSHKEQTCAERFGDGFEQKKKSRRRALSLYELPPRKMAREAECNGNGFHMNKRVTVEEDSHSISNAYFMDSRLLFQ